MPPRVEGRRYCAVENTVHTGVIFQQRDQYLSDERVLLMRPYPAQERREHESSLRFVGNLLQPLQRQCHGLARLCVL